jgi:hypothetical protein
MPAKIHTILITLLSQAQAVLIRNQQLLLLYSTLGLPAVALAWVSSRRRRKSSQKLILH